jgi:hypothetical protein
VVMQRKEMMSRIEGRVEGHACGVILGHVGGLHLGAGGPLNSHLTRSGTSGEATVSENRGESATKCVNEETGAEMQRMVAEMKEGVEQMTADRVMSDGVMSEQLREFDGVMGEQLRELRHVSARMEEQEAVAGQRLGEVGREKKKSAWLKQRFDRNLKFIF